MALHRFSGSDIRILVLPWSLQMSPQSVCKYLTNFYIHNVIPKLIMLSQLTIGENQVSKFSRCRISRDDMKMYMTIPIHQKGIVKMIWLEKRRKGFAND